MRDLDDLFDAAELDMLMAEVERVGLPRSEALGNERCGDGVPAPLEGSHLSPNRVWSAAVAFHAQRFVDPLRRAPLARGQLR